MSDFCDDMYKFSRNEGCRKNFLKLPVIIYDMGYFKM